MTSRILLFTAVAIGAGLLWNACAPTPQVRSVSRVDSALSLVNVRDLGAVGDGKTDDRAALQAALDAPGPHVVYLPNGTYLVSQAPRSYWSLVARPRTQIVGESRDTVIKLAPDAGVSVQLLEVLEAPDVTVTNLTLDGAKDDQSVLDTDHRPDQHRANLFAKQSPRLTLLSVTSRNATGDGVEIYDGSDDSVVVDLLATGNLRNGLTLGGGTTGGTFVSSQFVGNGAQQFDSEGAPVHNVTIRGCLFDGRRVSDDFVLTMTGMGADQMSHGWTVTDNVVNGGGLLVWISDVVSARSSG